MARTEEWRRRTAAGTIEVSSTVLTAQALDELHTLVGSRYMGRGCR